MTVHKSGCYIHSRKYVYVDHREQVVLQLLAADAHTLS
jgi:hypothetical protein